MGFKKLQREAKRQQTRRRKQREGIEQLCEEDPKAAEVLKSFNHSMIGRPRIEVHQPDLLSTIVTIVTASSATDNRRHCEMLRIITTLDDLQGELKKVVFKLSRSTTYLRLLPRRGNTTEGKRHVKTVPVKLLRPENNLRKDNSDRMFAKSAIDMFATAGVFGHDAVTFLSNDDKARVPLGLAAATLQAPIFWSPYLITRLSLLQLKLIPSCLWSVQYHTPGRCFVFRGHVYKNQECKT